MRVSIDTAYFFLLSWFPCLRNRFAISLSGGARQFKMWMIPHEIDSFRSAALEFVWVHSPLLDYGETTRTQIVMPISRSTSLRLLYVHVKEAYWRPDIGWVILVFVQITVVRQNLSKARMFEINFYVYLLFKLEKSKLEFKVSMKRCSSSTEHCVRKFLSFPKSHRIASCDFCAIRD